MTQKLDHAPGCTVDELRQHARELSFLADRLVGITTRAHIELARTWDDGWEMLLWAADVGANLAEMKAYRRAVHGTDLTVEG